MKIDKMLGRLLYFWDHREVCAEWSDMSFYAM